LFATHLLSVLQHKESTERTSPNPKQEQFNNNIPLAQAPQHYQRKGDFSVITTSWVT
jgi:hypothetical protein